MAKVGSDGDTYFFVKKVRVPAPKKVRVPGTHPCLTPRNPGRLRALR